MFDDHPALPTGSVPSNIPLGEPPDIFEGTETEAPMAPAPAMMAAPPVSAAGSALSAGILTPKAAAPSILETMPQAPSVMGSDNTIKEPKLSRGIMGVVMTLVIGCVLLGSGWFVYHMFTKKPADIAVVPVEPVPIVTSTPNEPLLPVVPITPSVDVTPVTSSNAVDKEILAGETPDSDGDGIKDDHEVELGLDPNNWDSDTDDLSDGEELLIWHTNPKNADTDSDNYKDGAEVKAGYNPSGLGRLAEVLNATSTPVMTSTSSTPVAAASSTTSTASDIEL